MNCVTLTAFAIGCGRTNLEKMCNCSRFDGIAAPRLRAICNAAPQRAVHAGAHNSSPTEGMTRAVFKLFRPKPAPAAPADAQTSSAEIRGTTTEGYHFALRLLCDRSGRAQRLIGWHGSSRGGARVEMQRDPDGVWRDLHGQQAAAPDALIPAPIRHSAAWTTQWAQLQPASPSAETACDRPILDLPAFEPR